MFHANVSISHVQLSKGQGYRKYGRSLEALENLQMKRNEKCTARGLHVCTYNSTHECIWLPSQDQQNLYNFGNKQDLYHNVSQ
jgi:hypothetical protein